MLIDMQITPMPAANMEVLLGQLSEIELGAVNQKGGGPSDAGNRLVAYFGWADKAFRLLRGQVSEDQIERLVRTKTYDRLLAISGPILNEPVVNGLISTELDSRIAELAAAREVLRRRFDRWRRDGAYLVFDTGVFIKHPEKLENLDLADLAEAYDRNIHVLVPMVVLDELDGLKTHNDHAGWRASYALARIDHILRNHPDVGWLDPSICPAAAAAGNAWSLEVVSEPEGHVRRVRNDDEIVAEAGSYRPFTREAPVLITFDTNMSTRARKAGVKVRKLDKPLGDEPSTISRRQQRALRAQTPHQKGRSPQATEDAVSDPAESEG